MTERIFGHIEGYSEGALFRTRYDLSKSGIHRPTQAGISGSEKEAADSIVLSGGYEDDEDFGDVIIYTGHGGRDPLTGEQESDQLLRFGNLALARNKLLGLPVRVVRGATHNSPHAPAVGYRYDGLYMVDSYWRDVGRSGHTIWRFRLVSESAPQYNHRIAEEHEEYSASARVKSTILRVIRDTKQARKLKELYGYRCQVCNTRLDGSAGPYAEAAHIRPLGEPHNGPDKWDNLLCLCPNHHILFDYGAFTIAEDLTLIGIEGRLHVHPKHQINAEHTRYHREHYFRAL